MFSGQCRLLVTIEAELYSDSVLRIESTCIRRAQLSGLRLSMCQYGFIKLFQEIIAQKDKTVNQ